MRYLLLLISASLFLTSCVKDKPQNPIQPSVQLTTAKKVYIINEGPFQTGDGSISLFDTGNNQVIENYYQTQNGTTALGNIAQSLNYFNSNFYIVVNNSGKVVVCNNHFKKSGQISGLTSPRYILPITNQKAYVSDIYANAISVVDLNSNTKTASIPCNGWTEQMVLIYNKAFVTNKNNLYIINTLSNTITDSINVGKNAGSMGLDKNDNLWVLSSGDKQNSILGKLTKIDPISNQILFTIYFNTNDVPNHLCFNKTKDTLYFLNTNIYRMAITDNTLPQNPIISSRGKNFYGLGINPNDFTIYAADALDYIQKSNIYIYDANGNAKNNFKAGLISNGFYFE